MINDCWARSFASARDDRRSAAARKLAEVAAASYRVCPAVAGGSSDGDGVVATFFLIRYQSVLASSSEMIFACQFFRISFFIIRPL